MSNNVATSRKMLKNFKERKQQRENAPVEESIVKDTAVTSDPMPRPTTRMDISRGTVKKEEVMAEEALNTYSAGNVIDTFDDTDMIDTVEDFDYIDEPVNYSQPAYSAPIREDRTSVVNAREILHAKKESEITGAPFDIASVQARKLKPKNISNVKEFDLNVFNVSPVTISRIVDTEGHISAAVRDIEDASGISVLPFPIAQLLPQVEELSGHKIMLIRGEKYVSGTTRIVNKGRFDTFVNKIKEEIMKGRIFDESLLEEVVYAGQSFVTMKFNHYELSMLNSMFINIQFLVYEDSLGDIRINVGGYTV